MGQDIAWNVAEQAFGRMMADVVLPLLAVFIAGAVLVYFIPFLVALMRRCKDKKNILLINLFLGWTIIGWVIALIQAFSQKTPPGARRKSSSGKKSSKKRKR
jgi:hypothetical protein